MAKPVMRPNVLDDPTRSVPEVGSGTLPGEAVSPGLVQRFIDGFYAATRDAVDVWGGPIALANQLQTAMSGVSDRLHRREVKGALNRAFIDYAAIATAGHPAAQEVFLFGLCDLFGFEHPKRKRTKTEREKYEALVRALRLGGELGEAAIRKAARDLGVDPSEFE